MIVIVLGLWALGAVASAWVWVLWCACYASGGMRTSGRVRIGGGCCASGATRCR